MPKISIIVPVYKVEQYIRRCLDSIVNQTFTDWECILVDDGSPDNSGKICDEYAEKDDRFRVFHQENAGVSAARNKGLDEARGEWISFVDSDDWVEKEMLKMMCSCAEQNKAEVVICGSAIVNENKTKEILKLKDGWLNMPQDYEWHFNAPWGKLYSKNIIDMYNVKFPLGITLAEDLYFVFNILLYAKKIYGTTRKYYNYFENLNSVTKLLSEKNIQDEIWVIDEIERNLIKMNGNNEWFKWLDQKKIATKDHYVFQMKPIRCDLWRKTYQSLNICSLKKVNLKRKVLYALILMHCDIFVKWLIHKI